MMHPHLNIAIQAARAAGNIITRALDRLDRVKIAEKGINDFVTNIDLACEKEIIEIIQKNYPEHGILGEESGVIEGSEDITWIIDPIDGTLNFTRGYPSFAISIAVKNKEHIENVAIYDPMLQELFTATKGEGAQLNERKIRVSNKQSIKGTLLATSFPFRGLKDNAVTSYLKQFKDIFSKCANIRQSGSAVLDLAYVAAGRLDAYWDSGLKPWDMAGGSLLIREAGGYISDFSGKSDFLDSGNIIAGTPKVHMEICKAISKK